ncbi:hypothetical protein HDU96_004984 [Phlyctochytrium bullatum]|nr:hypothetical protein HDU96_004984 [Phlyctochytrium bullatum]
MSKKDATAESAATGPDSVALKDMGATGSEVRVPNPSPELRASWLGKLIFTWLDGLLFKGYRTPLQMEDLYDLNEAYLAHGLADRFEKLWNETTKDGTDKSNPRRKLLGVFFKMFGRGFLPIGLLKFSADLCNAAAPLVLQAILVFISESSSGSNKRPLWVGLLWAFGLFCLNMYSSIAISVFFKKVGTYGMMVRATMTATIYRKALKLSGMSRQTFNQGRITNMISTDLVRLDQAVLFFHLTWTFLIQVLIIISLLIRTIGVSALAGFGLLLAFIPIQATIIKKLVQLRKMNASTTDSRVKLTNEVLSAIRVIKFFAWERSFLDRIVDIRTKELIAVVTANLFRSVVTAAGFAIPALAAAVTFMVYYAVDPSLDPVKVFTALALFNQLRNPIMWTPMMISSYADASVALTRMSELLFSAELDFQPETDEEAEAAIAVKDGNFYWESTAADQEAGKKEDKKQEEVVVEEVDNEDAKSVRSRLSIATDALASNTAPFTSSEALVTDLVENEEDGADLDQKQEEKANSMQVVKLAETDVERTSNTSDMHLTLRDIRFDIPKGALVAIVGAVGSGKTSLLSALVGSLKAVPPARVVFGGSVGYVPQQPWIMNSTLRDNILFGLPYEKERYRSAIDVCALTKDLEVISGGDMAEIGERGINLSGGQKQRVSLARLVYFNSDIVFLDDPLSAVDAHVGKHIFEKCIKGALGGKTRLLVTHQLHFVPQCDIVITMKDGQIAEMGSYQSLMKANGEFASLMRSYGGVGHDDEGDSKDDKSEDEKTTGVEELKEEERDVKEAGDESKQKKALILEEERMIGTLKNSVFLTLAIAMGGGFFMLLLTLTLTLTQVTRLVNDLWLVWWSSRSIPGLQGIQYLYVYLGLGISQAVTLFIFSALVAVCGMKAARTLHFDALNNILRSPVLFFDTNPLGRILNRFSRDQDIVDNTLPDAIRLFSITFGTCIATFGLVLYSTSGWFFLGLVPLMVVYYFVQDVYRCSARELKRLDSLTRSPLYAHISESITGISTIRAYNVLRSFIRKTESFIDFNNRPYYLQFTAQRWLGMRLEIIGNILVLSTSLYCVIQRDVVSPALMGLALSYVMQVTQLLSLCIRQYTEAEVQLVSVERLHYYATGVKTEAPEVIEHSRPPKGWPFKGAIEIKDLEMRYQEGLPLVLKKVSLEVQPREKIGVVGRTGSGKSSLMLALFRIVEPCGGSITIDGFDTSTLGLTDLRKGLAIIPQDPTLFSGTVRSNLDPFKEFDDEEMWRALENSGMKAAVRAMEGGLDAEITAGGENLSVGQRQLVCLARAMVRKPRIVVLDECTANVDLETDFLIQKSLRENFKDSTILTIAHRLNTVADYDKILALDHGEVSEFDTPANLLTLDGKEGRRLGIFFSLVEETGPTNAAVLRGMAMKETAAAL